MGISKLLGPSSLAPSTFWHRINTSGVKNRPILKKSYLFPKEEHMKSLYCKNVYHILLKYWLFSQNTLSSMFHRVLICVGFWICLWFWMCQGTEYTRVLNMPLVLNTVRQRSEYTRALDMLLVLNISGFWTCQGYTGFWICLNIPK